MRNETNQQQASAQRQKCQAHIDELQAVADLLDQLELTGLRIYGPSDKIDVQVPMRLGDEGFRIEICSKIAETLGTTVDLEDQPGRTHAWALIRIDQASNRAGQDAPVAFSSTDESRTNDQRPVSLILGTGL